MSNYILELKNISKNFSKVSVLNDINFQLKKGEVHALLGENGAGKSTLIKIISGALKPTTGKIFYHGKEVSFKSTIEAMNSGIIAVY